MTTETQNPWARRAALAVMALVMALMLGGLPLAYASANPVTADSTGSIEVSSGLEHGDTLKAYRIVTVTYDAAANTVEYALADGLSLDGKTGAEAASALMSLEDASQVKAAIEQLAAQVGADQLAGSAIVGNRSASVELSDLPMGEYLLLVTPAAGSADKVYQPTTASLVPAVSGGAYVLEDAAVEEVKSQPIDIVKVIGGPDSTATSTSAYRNGEAIPFTIKPTVPQYPVVEDASSTVHTTFIVGDSMDSGLTLSDAQLAALTVASPDGSETLAAGEDGAYTVAKTDNGFVITFDYAKVARFAGQKLLVSYEATLESTSASGVEVNTVTETYNRNPFDPTTYNVEATAEDHTFGFFLLKKGADGKVLPGATFTVSDPDGTLVGTITTDASGFAALGGLAAGKTYKLHESVAPAGYQVVSDFTVTISEADATLDNPMTAEATEGNYQDAGIVVDSLIGSLPATGEAGTIGLTAAGIGLIGLALILVRRSRSGRARS